MEHTHNIGAAQALAAAIRNITEEVPEGQPLGPAEQQIENILALLDPKTWPGDLSPAAVSTRLGQLSDYMAKLCEALADDTKLLREAAESFWPGHDFRRGLHDTTPGARFVPRLVPAPTLDSLTPSQRRIFDLVVAGRGNREIAAELRISVKTVDAHRSGIHRRLGTHTAADLVRLAVRLAEVSHG